MENEATVYIVIVNYNSTQYALECYNSLLMQSIQNFHTVIVDNKSQDEAVDELIKWPFKKAVYYDIDDAKKLELNRNYSLHIVLSNKNGGFAYGNNLFLKNHIFNNNDYVFLLNPDTKLAPDCLQNLFNFYNGKSNLILGCNIYDYYQTGKFLYYGANKVNFYSATVSHITKPKDLNKIDYIHGGALFTQYSTFKDVGFLDESYFLYWEETDWCYKALRQGYKLEICQEAVVYDKVGGSIGRGYLAYYYYTLNGLRFIFKHNRLFIYSAVLFVIIRILLRAVKLNFKAAKGIFNGCLHFVLQKHCY